MYNPNQGQQQQNQAFFGQNPQQQQQFFQQQQQTPQNGMPFQQQQQIQQHQQMYDPNAMSQQLQNQHLSGYPQSPGLAGMSGSTLGASGSGNMNTNQRPRTAGSLNSNSASREDDYVTIQRNTDNFSQITKERAVATRLKIELFYKQNVQHALERNQRRNELDTRLQNETRMSEERKNRQRMNLGIQESQFLRLRRTRLHPEDFMTVKVIGKGAFGEVRLVQKKDTGKIYAMKTLLKTEMFKKDQLAHVKAERDVLAESDSPWVVNLFYSFQDSIYLYLIMEFLPGGDLMTMLIKYEVFSEDVTRFYMAQCVLAIEAVHKLGFIHRDIKPDNILIDKDGHIKLSDFGLSTGFHKTHDQAYYQNLLQGRTTPSQASRNSVLVDAIHLTISNRNQINTWRKSRRVMAYSTVGTPDYIAPEIFIHQGYGQECDWWSLGTIMFECLVGWPPFCAEDAHETYRKIIHWPEFLYFPEEIALSREAEDLIRRFITSADQRIGRHGAEEIKAHPFFAGVDWDSLRKIEAPFKPQLKSMVDTSYFPTDELENVPDAPAVAAMRAAQQQGTVAAPGPGEETGLPFIGYTYKRFDQLNRAGGL